MFSETAAAVQSHRVQRWWVYVVVDVELYGDVINAIVDVVAETTLIPADNTLRAMVNLFDGDA